jgi:hypothetical protein
LLFFVFNFFQCSICGSSNIFTLFPKKINLFYFILKHTLLSLCECHNQAFSNSLIYL